MDKAERVFHKESSKEITTDNSSIDNSLIDNSTIGQGITRVKSLPEQLVEHQTRQKSIGQQQLREKERNARLLANAEIDECLSEWVMEGLTSEAFIPWVAKCCHTLSLQKVNRLAINARSGKSRDRLFHTLLKGAMMVHAKKQYYAEPTTLPVDQDH